MKYTQNRVENSLWTLGAHNFDVSGFAELWFENVEAITTAANSEVTRTLMEDEPRFLSGLTAMVIGDGPIIYSDAEIKFMVVAANVLFETCEDAAAQALSLFQTQDSSVSFVCDKLAPGFTRPGLWHEPVLPSALISVWCTDPRAGRDLVGSADSRLASFLKSQNAAAVAYKIDALRIVG